MDAFILAASEFSNQLMPILGAVVLVMLIVFLAKLIKFIKNLDATVRKTDTTIDLVDQSLTKAQSPLDTVVKLSGTVDKAHDATLRAVSDTKEYISNNAGEIKAKVKDMTKSFGSKEAKKTQPSPEDIIGGK